MQTRVTVFDVDLDVTFDISEDVIEIEAVEIDDEDVLPLLSESVFEMIEAKCWRQLEKASKDAYSEYLAMREAA